MLANQTVSFLPVDRLHEVAASAAEEFPTARPFPHVVLDGLFDPELLGGIVAEFPRPSDVNWADTGPNTK